MWATHVLSSLIYNHPSFPPLQIGLPRAADPSGGRGFSPLPHTPPGLEVGWGGRGIMGHGISFPCLPLKGEGTGALCEGL